MTNARDLLVWLALHAAIIGTLGGAGYWLRGVVEPCPCAGVEIETAATAAEGKGR